MLLSSAKKINTHHGGSDHGQSFCEKSIGVHLPYQQVGKFDQEHAEEEISGVRGNRWFCSSRGNRFKFLHFYFACTFSYL